MLVIKIEIWPGGSKWGAKEIARAHIANLSNLADNSDYAVSVEEDGNERLGIPYLKTSYSINGHNRRDTVFALLAKAFQPFLQGEQ